MPGTEPPVEAPEPGVPRAAGGFAAWLAAARAAAADAAPAVVPCAGCTACCRSAQFIAIEPDEADTLAHVPAALHLPAPGRPAGSVVLGFDAEGRCPLLGERGCSIYPHRPRACRRFDCRVFPATGTAVDAGRRPLLAAVARTWRFDVQSTADRLARDAVRAAAGFLDDHPEVTAGTPAAVGPGLERAALAVVLADLFLRRGAGGAPVGPRHPEPGEVRAEVVRRLAATAPGSARACVRTGRRRGGPAGR